MIYSNVKMRSDQYRLKASLILLAMMELKFYRSVERELEGKGRRGARRMGEVSNFLASCLAVPNRIK